MKRYLLLPPLLVIAAMIACGDDDGDGGKRAPTPETTTPDPVVCDGQGIDPVDLRCTGLYSNFETRAYSPDAKEFTPALSLWSDGAAKRRFLFLPPNKQIDTSNMDEWVFPVGTKVWKEFSVNGKLLETRMFSKTSDAPSGSHWIFTTYIWDADGSRATRVDTGRPNAQGTYEIPSKVQCSQCHNGHADRLLGLEAISLGLPSTQGVTLASLTAEGRLSAPPPVTSLKIPGDELTQKALLYLHVNCGITCHSPNGSSTSGFTGLLLRMSARQLLSPDGGTLTLQDMDAYRTTVGKDFVSAQYLDDDRFVNHKRIAPGDPKQSLVWEAMSMRGRNQMPPIASHEVDKDGAKLLEDWITQVK